MVVKTGFQSPSSHQGSIYRRKYWRKERSNYNDKKDCTSLVRPIHAARSKKQAEEKVQGLNNRGCRDDEVERGVGERLAAHIEDGTSNGDDCANSNLQKGVAIPNKRHDGNKK